MTNPSAMVEPMDVRIRDRYVQKGKLSRSDVEKYLKELPDSAANAEMIDYERIFEEDLGTEDDDSEG